MALAPAFMLFLIIVVEGYVVLSSELLAIRQTIPFVGSGTDTTSIIIAAVLMPLAVGYYFGGQYLSKNPSNNAQNSIRRKLLWNIMVSSIFLLIGLSTYTVTMFFNVMIENGMAHRLFMVTIYSIIFLVTPVYLLGQTVPLVSNYFSKEQLSKITGKMLFFSTVGSFLGAVFSTLVMMSFFGVNHTVTMTLALLAIISVIIAKKKRDRDRLTVIISVVLVAALANSSAMMEEMKIFSNNQYNTIEIVTDSKGIVHFGQNKSDSSALGPNGERHDYVEVGEELFVNSTLKPENADMPPKNFLIIGAGGFTFGLHDTKNKYTYIDIDPSLEDVAVKHFLKQPLTPNKKFVPVAAQGFLTGSDELYDLILVDVYNGDATLPEDLVTIDFYQSVKSKLTPNGVAVINLLISPIFSDPMSRNLDNTLHAVFPHIGRQVTKPFDVWLKDPYYRTNILYYYQNQYGDLDTDVVYTRDKNSVFYDKPQKRN